jgi:hypothetical protein
MSELRNKEKTKERVNVINKEIARLMFENKITDEEWNKEWINMFKVPEKK